MSEEQLIARDAICAGARDGSWCSLAACALLKDAICTGARDGSTPGMPSENPRTGHHLRGMEGPEYDVKGVTLSARENWMEDYQ